MRTISKFVLGIVVIVFVVWFISYSRDLYEIKKQTTVSSIETVEETASREVSYRRKTYVKAILVMGIDRKDSIQETKTPGAGGQADAIFLVAQDTARNTSKVLVLPRDTMTPITYTDLQGNVMGTDMGHLTLAYAYGNGRETSCEYMIEAVSQLLGGLTIDGYVAFNITTALELVDAVGGVPVIDGEKDVFLTSETAEAFLRYRDTTVAQSALERSERQKEFMESFVAQATKQASQDSDFVTNLFRQFEPKMITNLGKDQYMDMSLSFLGNGSALSTEDMITLPGEGVETQLYDEFYPDQEAMNQLVLDLFYQVEE